MSYRAAALAVTDYNTEIIAEFRANGGEVGGQFAGVPLLLLHTTGARSGQERIAPVMYRREGDHVYVFASRGGSPTHPAWYRNLLANPDVTVELGRDTFAARAVPLEGDERNGVFRRHAYEYQVFADYERKAQGRVIPVIELAPTR